MEFVYGEQTWGALFADGDGQLIPFTDNNAAAYISESMRILGISAVDLKAMRVLNIGSGREAIHFHTLGAGHVTHLDLARENLENTQRYALRHGHENLSSVHADIESVELPADEYDLIFLAGVYQHIRIPAKALINLAGAMKVGGRMYLGFFGRANGSTSLLTVFGI